MHIHSDKYIKSCKVCQEAIKNIEIAGRELDKSGKWTIPYKIKREKDYDRNTPGVGERLMSLLDIFKFRKYGIKILRVKPGDIIIIPKDCNLRPQELMLDVPNVKLVYCDKTDGIKIMRCM